MSKKTSITWKTWMEQYLIGQGLWPEEATEIVGDVVKHEKYRDALGPIINRSHDEYPAVMDTTVALILRSAAISWIDDNAPEHFARFILTESLPEIGDKNED